MRIVHLLNWDLKSIEKILKDIKAQGFDAIQINPMQPFKEEKTFEWWSSYQPLDFTIGNRFGSKEDLISLCSKAKAEGLEIYVDVILNHTANKSDIECLVPHSTVNKYLQENAYFWKKQRQLVDTESREDAVTGLIGLPGLNYKYVELRHLALKYLIELKKCGVNGFRFDAAKHIGLPNDGIILFEKIKEYVEKKGLFSYGEFLSNNVPWLTEFSEYIPVLTGFQSKIENTKNEVTFIESHDTYLNDFKDTTRRFSTKEIINLQGLLNSNYENTIYYVRPIYKPFDPKGIEIEDKNKETIDYFETEFLENKNFREINNIKKKELKYNIRGNYE